MASRRVGTLRYDDGNGLFTFDYDSEWTASGTGYPISPALPFDGLLVAICDEHAQELPALQLISREVSND